MAQTHQPPDDSLIKSGHQAAKCGKAGELSEIAENLKQIVPRKTKRALELAQEKRLLCMAHSCSPSRTGFQPH